MLSKILTTREESFILCTRMYENVSLATDTHTATASNYKYEFTPEFHRDPIKIAFLDYLKSGGRSTVVASKLDFPKIIHLLVSGKNKIIKTNLHRNGAILSLFAPRLCSFQVESSSKESIGRAVA